MRLSGLLRLEFNVVYFERMLSQYLFVLFTIPTISIMPTLLMTKNSGLLVMIKNSSLLAPVGQCLRRYLGHCALLFCVVLASCGGDSAATATANPPAAGAPALANLDSERALAPGQLASPIVFANSGGDVRADGCSASGLPTGLIAERVSAGTGTGARQTCQISGTPAMATAVALVTVTAVNDAGTDTATVSIVVRAEVVAPGAPMLADITGARTVEVGAMLSPIIFANSGGDVRADGCSASGLPAGLSIVRVSAGSGQTCQIMGMPTMAVDASVTVTAVNDLGSDMATVQITVNDVIAASGAPSLTDKTGVQTLVTGYLITPIVLSNSGDDVRPGGCTATGLPTGLEVERVNNGVRQTCQIIGTPAMATSVATYTVSATNAAATDTATVMIVVEMVAPATRAPGLNDDANVYEFPLGALITPINIFNSAGGVAPGGCSATGLPAGLRVDVVIDARKGACQILGTPSEVVVAAMITVTGTNALGMSSATATVTIQPPPPIVRISSISTTAASIDISSAFAGTAHILLRPSSMSILRGPRGVTTIKGEASTRMMPISANTPLSLALSAPELVANSSYVAYVVVVSTIGAGTGSLVDSGLGSRIFSTPQVADAPVRLQVTPGRNTASVVVTSARAGSLLTAVRGIGPAPTIRDVRREATAPSRIAISAGGSRLRTLRALTPGTPVTVYAAMAYGGDDFSDVFVASFTPGVLTPTFVLPRFELVYVVGETIERTFASANRSGARITACSVASLPMGLSMTALAAPDSGCRLAGTVSTATAASDYTITAASEAGSVTLTLNITVAQNAATSGLSAPDLSMNVALPFPLNEPTGPEQELTNIGGNPTSCSVDTNPNPSQPLAINSPLPNALMVILNDLGTSCRFIGTPTVANNANILSAMVATNGAGSSTKRVIIHVIAPTP